MSEKREPTFSAQPDNKRKNFKQEQLERYQEVVRQKQAITLNKKGDLHAARPKGVVPKIKEATDNFEKLIDFWAEVAFTGEYQGKAFGARERIHCSELLALRGMGKPVEAHVLVDARNLGENGEVNLSSEQLTKLVYALAPPPGSAIQVVEGNIRRGDAHYAEMPDVMPGFEAPDAAATKPLGELPPEEAEVPLAAEVAAHSVEDD